jgi:hypothetical protein
VLVLMSLILVALTISLTVISQRLFRQGRRG